MRLSLQKQTADIFSKTEKTHNDKKLPAYCTRKCVNLVLTRTKKLHGFQIQPQVNQQHNFRIKMYMPNLWSATTRNFK
jgi:hypothetical protein